MDAPIGESSRAADDGRTLIGVGDLLLDPGTHEVTRDGVPLAVTGLSYRLLLALVEAAPDMLTTEALIERVWAGRVVGNETVTQRARLLRRALGDDAADPRYVGVVRGEGYRLLAPVQRIPQLGSVTAPATPRGRAGAARALAGILILAVVLAALLLPRLGPGAPPEVRVRMFASQSVDPEQAFFAEGLTADVIDRLARIEGLRLVTGADASPGADDADTVLTGLVDWDGERARITARLVDADGATLWSDAYAYAEGDRFEAQARIAEAVARALRVTVLGTTPDGIGTDDVRAYAHYLRGLLLFGHHTHEKNEGAIEAFRAALSIDPDFVRAWIQLGQAYGARAREPEGRAAAIQAMAEATARARSLAPEHWDPLTLEAWLHLTRLDFVEADRTMRRALAQRVDLADGRDVYCPIACFHDQFGRVTEALAEARRWQSVDPLTPSAETHRRLWQLGRTTEARAAFEAYEALQPQPLRSRNFRRYLDLAENDPGVMNAYLEGTPLAGLWGRDAEIVAAVRRLAADPPMRRGARLRLAKIAAVHGDAALATELLREEYLQPGYGYFFKLWDPALASVRATPAFAQFVTELGLVDAWRSSGDWGDFCRETADETVRCR